MKVRRIWISAFFLTLASGLYIVKPLILGAIELHLGFPAQWLMASRSVLPGTPWRFNFLWKWFIVDLAIYILLITTAIWIYEKKLKPVNTHNIYRLSFLLLNIILVICCLVFIIWMLLLDFGLLNSSKIGYNIYLGIWTWLRFLLGFMATILTWFLIRYFKRTSTT